VPAFDLVLPGDPQTPTGGFLYDRRITLGLGPLGWRARVHALDASFPWPTPAALGEAQEELAAIPSGRVVVIDGLALGGMPELVGAEARRLRLVALIHHPLAAETGLDTTQSRTLKRAEQRGLASMRRVIVTSPATARALSHYGVAPERLGVVVPGTDPASPARGSGGEVPGLLCVATLTPRKGHAILLDALGQVRDRPWRLTFVGSLVRSPDTVAALRRQAASLGLEQRVAFLGEVDAATLAACYEHADVFVLPSYLEGYGMALAEALARGLPIVSTLAGAIPETVPLQAGLLVPPGDSRALAGALARILDEPILRRRLAEGARAAGGYLPSWEDASACFARELGRVSSS
jgi:glycosyltransferase involved in cell wall biosynthesis